MATIASTLSFLPSPALLAFVKRQVTQEQDYSGPERRDVPRLFLAMPVTVQGVDEQIAPVGDPHPMVVRDYSPKGIGLVHEFPFEYKRIVVELTYPAEGQFLAAEVRWSKPLGPFYHLGCEIVARLDRFPQQ